MDRKWALPIPADQCWQKTEDYCCSIAILTLVQVCFHAPFAFHSNASAVLPNESRELAAEQVVSALTYLYPPSFRSALHPACSVYRVSKQTISRHAASHDPRTNGAGVQSHPDFAWPAVGHRDFRTSHQAFDPKDHCCVSAVVFVDGTSSFGTMVVSRLEYGKVYVWKFVPLQVHPSCTKALAKRRFFIVPISFRFRSDS
mmetsp:Transcript_2900/g.7039  ORF Transcript_2900/g.7039 Transcript_2900/m.7039 type:complete len:200 (+) Transcript_2900:108-707(+)